MFHPNDNKFRSYDNTLVTPSHPRRAQLYHKYLWKCFILLWPVVCLQVKEGHSTLSDARYAYNMRGTAFICRIINFRFVRQIAIACYSQTLFRRQTELFCYHRENSRRWWNGKRRLIVKKNNLERSLRRDLFL